MDAARSLGMSYRLAMRSVVLPQAVVRMIPPLGNEFIALNKNSALVSLLTIHDVMHDGQKSSACRIDRWRFIWPSRSCTLC